MLMFADPKEWWLEISPSAQTAAVQQSQSCSTPQSRYRAYLNALCVNAMVAWLRSDVPEARAWLAPADCGAVWEVVNGMAVTIGQRRLILIPTEAIDDGGFEVPQEWVDSPSWAGDYYLAMQVNPERGWIRVWGFATHQELQTIGQYDPDDRTYTLAAEQVTQDLNVFWATYQLCGAAQTRSAIAALPELATNQAAALIQRLGNPSVVFPRLAVPFGLWAALLARADWRQALYQQRCGQTGQPLKLSQWIQGQFTAVWQAVDTMLLPTQAAMAWRNGEQSVDAIEPAYAVQRVKILSFDLAAGTSEISLLVGLTPIDDSQINIGLYICPVGDGGAFLQAIQVRLLDGLGTEIGQARATATETIQFQFGGQVGEQFQVEITMGERTQLEPFEI